MILIKLQPPEYEASGFEGIKRKPIHFCRFKNETDLRINILQGKVVRITGINRTLPREAGDRSHGNRSDGKSIFPNTVQSGVYSSTCHLPVFASL
jgi:hypothetical protein